MFNDLADRTEKHFDNPMDTIKSYQSVIKQVISEYAKFRPSHGNIHLEPIFDGTLSNSKTAAFRKSRLPFAPPGNWPVCLLN